LTGASGYLRRARIYLLGVWLGDGATTGGTIHVGDEDLAHFEPLGRLAGSYPRTNSSTPRWSPTWLIWGSASRRLGRCSRRSAMQGSRPNDCRDARSRLPAWSRQMPFDDAERQAKPDPMIGASSTPTPPRPGTQLSIGRSVTWVTRGIAGASGYLGNPRNCWGFGCFAPRSGWTPSNGWQAAAVGRARNPHADRGLKYKVSDFSRRWDLARTAERRTRPSLLDKHGAGGDQGAQEVLSLPRNQEG
jgi:hypothetical protein